MTATAEQFRLELLALPDGDRAELAYFLLESLQGPVLEAEEQTFDAELARRAEEIRGGQVAGISAEELFARLDAKLAAVDQ